MTTRDALAAAIAATGSQTELACLLTAFLKDHPNPKLRGRVVTQAHVANWVRRDRVANDMCGAIQHLTGVPSVALRPDVFYEVD